MTAIVLVFMVIGLTYLFDDCDLKTGVAIGAFIGWMYYCFHAIG